jgi:hypothetical protein
MSTLTASDIPLSAEGPAQRLRRTAAAVRVLLHWWGVHRALTAQQKEELGAVTAADARFLTAGKKLVDTRHEAFRRLTSVRHRITGYWRGISLPYVEPGVRLIRQADVPAFVHTLEGFRDELHEAEAQLNAAYAEVKADARPSGVRYCGRSRIAARHRRRVARARWRHRSDRELAASSALRSPQRLHGPRDLAAVGRDGAVRVPLYPGI